MLPPKDDATSQLSTAVIRYARLQAVLTRWRPRRPRGQPQVIELEQAQGMVARRLLVHLVGLLWQMTMELQRTGGNPAIIRRGIALRDQLEQAIGYSLTARQLDIPRDIPRRDHP
jgi:hypothetical protein